jgi:PhzF family phenazine biosynthesis protein
MLSFYSRVIQDMEIIRNLTGSTEGSNYFLVDAFTDSPFSGNPAAVCFLSEARSEEWMQNVASEVKQSETSFLYEKDDGFNLRWFTPAVEIDLCGHGTLASAHVLWETGVLGPEEKALFHTRSGLLTAQKRRELIELDFPAENEMEVYDPPQELIRALGVRPKYIGRNRFDFLVELESEEDVLNMKPDFVSLTKVSARGVIITSTVHGGKYDFISRFFAPSVGIDEDPVTGSAHCCLGPFWGRRLGKQELTAYQASSRGGLVYLSLRGDRVGLGGKAVTVVRGRIVLV